MVPWMEYRRLRVISASLRGLLGQWSTAIASVRQSLPDTPEELATVAQKGLDWAWTRTAGGSAETGVGRVTPPGWALRAGTGVDSGEGRQMNGSTNNPWLGVVLLLFAAAAALVVHFLPSHGYVRPTVAQLEAAHPTWTAQEVQLVSERKVWIGMTEEQAIESWGKPSNMNTTAMANYIQEQWVYRLNSYRANYLYFENGILTTWQTQ